ncbi:hypothetical protein [Flavobacterium seoulense]|uniref:Lipoprotein n=1 Tax=Flavobacterium seoulense TaxID=1492738 RepID=A0A066WJK2_9FLAO|nr:hypothetical protein [Flavobacterium seoulense]KDN54016.1 hypothetical protein FEM21_28330 [Flavobacterium seoulense]
MRTILLMLLFIVVSCGKESSPEGRSKIRDEKLQEKIDSLQIQNKQIIKDINMIKKQLNIEEQSN